MRNPPHRAHRRWLTALCAFVFAQPPAAAEEPVTDAAAYTRWHASAVAFANTADKIAPRYGALDMAEVRQARQLIAASEQAAQRRDYVTARQQARQAYEMLRAAIAAAASRPDGK